MLTKVLHLLQEHYIKSGIHPSQQNERNIQQ